MQINQNYLGIRLNLPQKPIYCRARMENSFLGPSENHRCVNIGNVEIN